MKETEDFHFLQWVYSQPLMAPLIIRVCKTNDSCLIVVYADNMMSGIYQLLAMNDPSLLHFTFWILDFTFYSADTPDFLIPYFSVPYFSLSYSFASVALLH